MTSPVFETARLVAREMSRGDLDFVAEMLADPEVMRFYPKPLTRDEAAGWLERQLRRYREHGHGLWLILERGELRPVGQVGLLLQTVDGREEPEVGYLVHRPFWRRGYAAEAAAATRDHAFRALGLPRVISLIRPGNLPSQGVARKLGMTPERTTTFAGLEHLVLSVERAGRPPLGLESGTVRVVPSDPAWPALFAAEAGRIAAAAGALPLRLEHVGSTSVPGLAAKPVLDVLAGRPPGEPAAPYVEALRRAGYEHRGEQGIPGREFFRRGTPRSHHVHLTEVDSPFWRDHLAFRDALRADPALAAGYGALKAALAARHPADREAYTDGKGPFVARVLERARSAGA